MPIGFGATAVAPRTAAEDAQLGQLSPELSASVIRAAVFRITNCFTNDNAFMNMLLNNGCTTPREVLYFDARIAQHAGATTEPSAADAISFLAADAGANLTWNNAGDAPQLLIDQNRVAGRVLLLFSDLLSIVRQPAAADVDDDRVSLLQNQNASCSAANLRFYGTVFSPSELPVNNILGKIYRGFVSGMIPIIPLDKIVAQNEVSSAEKFHFDVAAGVFAKKRSAAKISSMSDFLFRLSMRNNGMAYIGIVFTVDEAVWGGCLPASKVGPHPGTCVQFTRRDGARYLECWRPYLAKFENNLEHLVRFDYKIQRLVPDMFAERVRYGSALVDAFNVMRGEIATFTPRKRGGPPGLTGQTGQTGGGGGGGGGGDGKTPFDFAKKAKGFIPTIRTAQKNAAGEGLCKAYNDRRNGDCKFGANCKFKHQCDVLVNGTACGAEDHCRLTHE